MPTTHGSKFRSNGCHLNRAAIGIACAKAIAMRIDIAHTSALAKSPLNTSPTPTISTSLHTPTSTTSNTRHLQKQKIALKPCTPPLGTSPKDYTKHTTVGEIVSALFYLVHWGLAICRFTNEIYLSSTFNKLKDYRAGGGIEVVGKVAARVCSEGKRAVRFVQGERCVVYWYSIQ